MPELQRLRADHAPAILAFETANRTYFAASISDRGDEYFEHFAERHNALLAEQEAGIGAYYVLLADGGAVLGRFNLVFVEDGVARLGYRVARHVAGRGVATATVRDLCSLAAAQHELRTFRAATSRENLASQRVLLGAGFRPVGPAAPSDLGGKQGTWYQRDVVSEPGRDD
jgi:ribosomal-protein-alanine N-acetyltransferase